MPGGIEAIAASISADLARRLPRQNKKQREGLSLLVATMLDVGSASLMELSASLPRDEWISRLLGIELIDTDVVMAPFAHEVPERVSAEGQPLVLIIAQTQANDTQQHTGYGHKHAHVAMAHLDLVHRSAAKAVAREQRTRGPRQPRAVCARLLPPLATPYSAFRPMSDTTLPQASYCALM